MLLRYLIACVLLCSSLLAKTDLEQYRIYVKEIDEEHHNVSLTNGLVCQVAPQHTWLEKNLEIGDEVMLDPITGWPKTLNLRFMREKTPMNFNVLIDEESKKNCLRCVSVTVVCLQPAGWFYNAVNQLDIELSDGSKWIFADSSLDHPFVKSFEKGDHVMILIDGQQSIMVNLDKRACMPIKPAN